MAKLQEQEAEWLVRAPIVVRNQVMVPASVDRVFERLADIGTWPEWCTGVSKASAGAAGIEAPARGVGARRSVWIGPIRFDERFVAWEEGVRVTFCALACTGPGLRALVEDWAVAPVEGTDDACELTQTMGVEVSAALRPLSGVLRRSLARATLRGAKGMATFFAT